MSSEQNMAHKMILRAEIPTANQITQACLCARRMRLQAGQPLNFVSHILLAVQRHISDNKLHINQLLSTKECKRKEIGKNLDLH